MSDHGRIHRKFHAHPKVAQCSNGAIGLWAKANSWCRDNRTAGIIPLDDVLTLGSRDEAEELVRAKLWLKSTRNGVPVATFNDYGDWNSDVEPDTEAGNLVRAVVPASHPSAIRAQLSTQAARLLAEGISAEVVKQALRLWLSKSLSPSLLPSLASEAMKDAQREASFRNVVDRCLRDNTVSPLRDFGFVFEPPPAPPGLGVVERREFMSRAKRSWLQSLRRNNASSVQDSN